MHSIKILAVMLLIGGVAYAGSPKMTEYYKEGCPYCKKMEAVVQEFEKAEGVKVTVEKDQKKAQKAGIKAFPTFVIEKDKKVIGVALGAKPLKALQEFWKKPAIEERKENPVQIKAKLYDLMMAMPKAVQSKDKNAVEKMRAEIVKLKKQLEGGK